MHCSDRDCVLTDSCPCGAFDFCIVKAYNTRPVKTVLVLQLIEVLCIYSPA